MNQPFTSFLGTRPARVLSAALPFLLATSAAHAQGWVWSEGMLTIHQLHTATLLADGDVLVAGGLDHLTDAVRYHPDSQTWTNAQSMPVPRSQHTATLLADGRVLFVGNCLQATEVVGLYDPVSDTWSSAASMGQARCRQTATRLANGRVLIVGGNADSGAGTTSTEIYDPVADQWIPGPPLLVDRTNSTAIALQDGRVLVVGGLVPPAQPQGDPTATAAAEIYDPATNQWSAAPNLPEPSLRMAMTLLDDGRVMLSGGSNEFNQTSGIVTFYDAMANAWATPVNMQFGRSGHTATLLVDGSVLLAGGSGPLFDTSWSADVFDPSTLQWAPRNAMLAQFQGTATRLPNGEVLAVGLGAQRYVDDLVYFAGFEELPPFGP